MSISSPLPSSTFSSKPLQLTLALEGLNAPRSERASPPSSIDADSPTTTTPAEDCDDVFDEFDHGRASLGSLQAPNEPKSRDRERQQPSTSLADALADRSSILFPTTDLQLERELARSESTGAGGLPEWLRETSGRVTSIAVGEIYKAQLDSMGSTEEQNSGSDRPRKMRRTRRIAVGSEDGVVWVFRDQNEASRVGSTQTRRHDRDSTITRLDESATTRPHRLFMTSTRPSSPRPPSSHKTFSPTPDASLSPRLTTRRSSASLSTLSSFSSQPAARTASGPPSLSESSTTYSELRSLPEQRLRKASATVSVSTTSVTPIPGSHRHSASQDSSVAARGETHQDSSSVTMPPLSPLDHSNYPISPVPTHPPPQFRFSPSTPANGSDPASRRTTPSPSPSPSPRILHSSSSGISSRKEHLKQRNVESRNRSHSRGLKKESITNGIGLWENSSTTDVQMPDEERSGLGIVNGDVDSDKEEDWEVEQPLTDCDLVPVLKILSPGSGDVVGMHTAREHCIAGSRIGRQDRDSRSDMLIVLRRSGHLSVLSLDDGKVLASTELGRHATGDFATFEVVDRDSDAPLVFCSVRGAESAVVCVDLATLGVLQTLGRVEHFAIARRPTSHSLLYLAPGSSELLSRSINASVDAGKVVSDAASPRVLFRTSQRAGGLRTNGYTVVSWDQEGVSVAKLDQDNVPRVATISCADIYDVLVEERQQRFVVVSRDCLQIYRMIEDDGRSDVKLEKQIEAEGIEACHLHVNAIPNGAGSTSLLYSRLDEGDNSRSLACFELQSPQHERTIYRSAPMSRRVQATRSRKVDSHSVLIGFSDGEICHLKNSSLSDSSPPVANARLTGAISVLDVIELGNREVVVAGSVEGTIGVWNLSDWAEVAVFSLFASPVLAYARLSLPSHPHTLLFVSCNSPIALVSLHPPELLFTLPGSRTPVQLVATTKQGEVMVLYKQGLARVWDAELGELRRSMDRKTAEAVLKETEKPWRIWFDSDVENAGAASSSLSHPCLAYDLRSTLEDISRELPWAPSRQRTPKNPLNGFDSLDATPDISRAASPAHFAPSSGITSNNEIGHLATVRSWLSHLVPFDVDTECDQSLGQLDVSRPPIQLPSPLNQPGSLAFPTEILSKSAWMVSSDSTARRLLLITCLLRVFLNYPSTERTASEAIVRFCTFLEECVGSEFQRPSLEYLGNYWMDKNPEVQQAARTLFGTHLAALSNSDTLALVQDLEDCLPSRQRLDAKIHAKADTAILLVGLIAVDRFKLLSTSVLTDLSASIATYLDESQHPFHQAIATELCSRGFHIWQNFVDAMGLVRQLFSIAIGRNPSTPSDLRALARIATVHVAGVNPPLFMSTLLFDILNAPTVVSRNATLKLLGFIIRKKPLVLYHSLPRVVEAVVKSLDPTVSDLRETVHQTATVILNELVRTFPTIDFHGKSQRLAVGTSEGSAIVYDLKTATRLYVLDGHRRPLTAVSWSPDGHRLASVSLDESKVCIWKTGMGILSIIGAPTQRAGSPPFKEWDFHVGDEALMTTAATLEWVIVDWPAERTVRLRIRETALSFGA